MEDMTNTTAYYELLGLEKGDQTTQEDIKRAWRKAALRLHPDRNPDDPEAESRFKQVKDAYDVLSDPEKRKTYDKHGVEGLKVKEAMENMDPSVLLGAFVESGWGPRIAMVCTIICCCGILMIFPIFLILKVDHSITWAWPAVFAPLFVCNGTALLCACFAAVKGERASPDEALAQMSAWERVLVVAGPALWLIFWIIVAVYLDDPGGMSFAAACIPAFLNEALGLVRMPVELSTANYRAQEEAHGGSPQFPFTTYWEYVGHHAVIKMLRVVQWVLVCVQVSLPATSKMSWWAVLLPAWALAAYGLVRLLLRFSRMGAKVEERPDKPLSATDEDEEPRETDNLQSLCVSGCAALPGLIALMLLASRLDGGPLSTQSLAVVFSPVFAVCGLVLLIVSCAIICIRKVVHVNEAYDDEEEMDEEMGGQGHEAGDTAPTADVEGHDAAPAAPAIILSGPPDAGGASGAPIVLAPVNGAVADATAGASMQSDALSGPAAEVSELAAAASEAAAPALIQTLDDTEAPKTEAEASKQQAKESIAPPPSDAAPHENPAS